MTTKSKTLKAEAHEKRLTDLDLADALNNMKDRFFGIEAAIAGGNFPHTNTLNGVLQIADDVAEGMRALAESWEAERQLRMVDERQ